MVSYGYFEIQTSFQILNLDDLPFLKLCERSGSKGQHEGQKLDHLNELDHILLYEYTAPRLL